MARAAANHSAGLAFPLSSNSELLAAYSLIIFLWSPSAVWTLLIAKCSISQSHCFVSLSALAEQKVVKKRMDPVTLSLTAAAAELGCGLPQHYHSRTEPETTLLSRSATFSALGSNNKKGSVFNAAHCLLFYPGFSLFFTLSAAELRL